MDISDHTKWKIWNGRTWIGWCKMKIALLSDTHGYHNRIKEIPNADVFVYAGDMSQIGKWQELKTFRDWLYILPYKNIVLIAGNHDLSLQDEKAAKQFFKDFHYLHDDEVMIDGIKFYGTPWQPVFFNWAFNRDEEVLKSKFSKISDDTSVLVTHCGPFGLLDYAPPLPHIGRYEWEHVGSKVLYERMMNLSKLKLHCFGHIHESRGNADIYGNFGNHVTFVNCSYNPNNPQIYVVEI